MRADQQLYRFLRRQLLFDKVKLVAFDAGQLAETVLLGSSQILMLQRVRETLAGRAFVSSRRTPPT